MFGLFKNKSRNTKHNHLTNLVSLAKSDGRVDEREVDLLRKIATLNGINEKTFLAILETSDPLDIDLNISKQNRLSQLFDYIQMMLIDDEVSDSEIKFCINVAEKMNFEPKFVVEIVNKMMENIKAGISKELVCKEIESTIAY